MTANIFSDALGEISEKYIMEAVSYQPKKKWANINKHKHPLRQGWFKRGTIAACLCIALAIGMLVTPNSDIITGPGLLTVTAYASSTSENIELFEEYNMQENITLPYEYGWAITTSVVPGLPLKFSVPEYSKATIEISVSGGQFISWEKSTGDTVRDTNVLGQSFVIPNNSTIYWQNYVKNADAIQQFTDDIAYVDVVLYDDTAIIGYAVIGIYSVNNENTVPRYVANILKTVSFPDDNGKHQNVSKDYVDKQLAAAKENNTVVPMEQEVPAETEPLAVLNLETLLSHSPLGEYFPTNVLDGYELTEEGIGLFGEDQQVLQARYYNKYLEDHILIGISPKDTLGKVELNEVQYLEKTTETGSRIYVEAGDYIVLYQFSSRDIKQIDNFEQMVVSSAYHCNE